MTDEVRYLSGSGNADDQSSGEDRELDTLKEVFLILIGDVELIAADSLPLLLMLFGYLALVVYRYRVRQSVTESDTH